MRSPESVQPLKAWGHQRSEVRISQPILSGNRAHDPGAQGSSTETLPPWGSEAESGRAVQTWVTKRMKSMRRAAPGPKAKTRSAPTLAASVRQKGPEARPWEYRQRGSWTALHGPSGLRCTRLAGRAPLMGSPHSTGSSQGRPVTHSRGRVRGRCTKLPPRQGGLSPLAPCKGSQ